MITRRTLVTTLTRHCAAWSASPGFYLWTLLATFLCVTGYLTSAIFRRKPQADLPDYGISIESDTFRYRKGMGWEYESFQITAKDLLKHWRGVRVGRGSGCRLQAYAAGPDQRQAALSVSHHHARLDFDEKRRLFYIEDTGSQNKTRWASLNEPQVQDGKLLEGRKYLLEDTRVWLGSVTLDLRLQPLDSVTYVKEPGNTVGAWMVVALQAAGIIFCTGYTNEFTVIRCLPGILMSIIALQTLFFDHARNPIPGIIFAVLTYSWVLYVSFSGDPDDTALAFSRSLFCIGTAVICLLPDMSSQDMGHFSAGTYFKAGIAVVLVVILYHYGIISTYNDAILLLALILARKSKNLWDMLKRTV